MRILQQNGKTHRKALAGECGFSSAAHAGEGSCCSEQQLQMKDEDEQLYQAEGGELHNDEQLHEQLNLNYMEDEQDADDEQLRKQLKQFGWMGEPLVVERETGHLCNNDQHNEQPNQADSAGELPGVEHLVSYLENDDEERTEQQNVEMASKQPKSGEMLKNELANRRPQLD